MAYKSRLSIYKKSKIRVVYLLVTLVVLFAFGGIFYVKRRHDALPKVLSVQSKVTPTPNIQPPQKPTVIKLLATGDWLPHEAINQAAKTADGSYDYKPLMQGMDTIFKKADVRFCNQSVLGAGSAFGISGYPVFNAPTEFSRDMYLTGCNVINTGTNHTNDKTQAAINASVSVWDSYKDILAVAGANRSVTEQKTVRYFTVNSIKFAFLSYTTYTNKNGETSYGLTTWDDALVKQQMTEARAQADIVLVSVRWGTEYSPGINAAQNKYAQTLADLGADIVLGHGSHVLEPVKVLSGVNGHETTVWFSIGNFINAQLETEALFNGIAVMDIDIASKKVLHPRFLPFYMHYEWTADQKARQDLMARKNFQMYLLENAAEPLKRSQLQTTIEEQKQRMQTVLNTYTTVPLITGSEL
jgi:poly-gamma-glutamate capsule biosynthesis protein CapA/YwtB (metallophosphatase superfamily)